MRAWDTHPHHVLFSYTDDSKVLGTSGDGDDDAAALSFRRAAARRARFAARWFMVRLVSDDSSLAAGVSASSIMSVPNTCLRES